MSEPLRGDCLTCARVSACPETSLERVKESYSCPLFQEVPEPVYLARIHMIEVYGEEAGIHSLLDRPAEEDEPEIEEDEDGSDTDAEGEGV